MHTDDAQRSRVELRLDPALHDRLKSLATEAGLSVNQLVSGILTACAKHAHVGHPVPEIAGDRQDAEEYGVRNRHVPSAGLVWFGSESALQRPIVSDEGMDCYIDDTGQLRELGNLHGEVWFELAPAKRRAFGGSVFFV